VGGAPDGGDTPAKELEFSDGFQSSSRIFVVGFVELECVDGSLVVDADEYCGAWQGGGEKCGDCFLYGMEFGVKDLSPTAKMTSTFGEPVELLVPTVVYRPSASDSAIVEFGTICIYGNCMVGKRL
jgi:hypothetical protein